MRKGIIRALLPLFCLLLMATGPAKAQDIHFSQFYFSPLTLSPAQTGFFRDGIYRFAANFRNQWSFVPLPYTTYSASFDVKVLQGIMSRNDVFATGIYVFNDQAGKGGLARSGAKVSMAFHKDFYEGLNTVAVGIQAGIIQYGFDPNILVFGDQIEAGTILPGGSADIANIAKTDVSYADINAGALWNFIPSEYLQIYSGITLYHLNNPDISFLKEDWQLSQTYTLYGGAAAKLDAQFDFLPAISYMGQKGNNELLLGSALRYNSNENTGIRFGAWYRLFRNSDAIVLMSGLDFNTLKAGLSYDVNLGRLSPASRGNGAFELAVLYVFGKPKRGTGTVRCPRF